MKLNKVNQLLKKYHKRYKKLRKESNNIINLFTYNWNDPLFVKSEKLNRIINNKIAINFEKEEILFKKREEIHARNK